MKLFVAITGHATLLPHFLRHYSAVGVTRYFVGCDRELAGTVEQYARGVPVEVITEIDATESIEGGTAAVTTMRLRYSSADEWVVIADLDEFQIHPAGLDATAAAADAEGANVVRGTLVDRVSSSGRLESVGPDDDVDRRFPEECYLTAHLQGGLAYKCALVKGLLGSGRTDAGLSLAHHHMAGERLASARIRIMHFKWNAEAVTRMAVAIARVKAAQQPFWTEYRACPDSPRNEWSTHVGGVHFPAGR